MDDLSGIPDSFTLFPKSTIHRPFGTARDDPLVTTAGFFLEQEFGNRGQFRKNLYPVLTVMPPANHVLK